MGGLVFAVAEPPVFVISAAVIAAVAVIVAVAVIAAVAVIVAAAVIAVAAIFVDVCAAAEIPAGIVAVYCDKLSLAALHVAAQLGVPRGALELS